MRTICVYSHSPRQRSFVPGCNLSFDGAVGAGLPVGPADHDIRLAADRHLVPLADRHQLGRVPSICARCPPAQRPLHLDNILGPGEPE